MVALSRNVTRKQAMEMLLTGEPISATRARELGLVNRVVAVGTERDAAIALAQKVALKSAYTIKLGKEAFYRQAEMSLPTPTAMRRVMTENMMARDAEEGIGAFIEKREPKWQDKELSRSLAVALEACTIARASWFRCDCAALAMTQEETMNHDAYDDDYIRASSTA
jgi:1,4-dihydroxy-2-naphthoyl-CoA synthase